MLKNDMLLEQLLLCFIEHQCKNIKAHEGLGGPSNTVGKQ